MEQWHHEYGVPVFRPHERRDDKGKVAYVVTASDLHLIAKNSNAGTADLHGATPPQTEGHRNFAPDAKETDQPEVLGYCDNFRVGRLPDGTACIVCDRHTQAKFVGRAASLPYVSVEYQAEQKRIIGVARLKRPPYLNLGGTFYPDGQNKVYIYSWGTMDEKAKQPEAQPADTEELTPEEQAAAEKVYRYMCKKYAWMADSAKKYEAVASATNTGTPDMEGKPKPEPDGDEPEEYKALRLKVQKLEAERERDKVAKLVDTLKVEGYQFDAQSEEARLLAMDEQGRNRRVDEVRKYHQRTKPSGTAAPVQVYQGSVAGAEPKPISQEDVAKALVHMRTNGGEFHQALAAVTKK